MKYNFDERVERENTSCYKYDMREKLFGTGDVLPMWVADMDFRTPPFIVEALQKRLDHAILGYTLPFDNLTALCAEWQKRRYGWETDPSWFGFVPGIVTGLGFAVNTFSQPGDKIVIQSPVYPPFFNVPLANGREVVYNPLKEVNGQFEMDFDLLEKQLSEEAKLFIFCHPHNPGGRVWDRPTLERVAELCAEKGVLVISDEIHADMTFHSYRHIPFASVSEAARDNTITFMSPSKTFNVPGLINSYWVIPNDRLRRQYSHALDSIDLHVNLFGFEATRAAYTQGEEWLDQLVDYLEGNARTVVDYCEKHIPQVSAMMPQASFLVWLDFSALGLDKTALRKFVIEKAALGLNDGPTFGIGGEGHQRINVGCPRSVVLDAMERLEKAVKAM
jgi:cysteine-S-conjugate beta-lyase